MIISFTGHRNLNGLDEKIKIRLIEILDEYKPEHTISGMALGFDILAAKVCIDKGIKFIAAIPGFWQPNRWPKDFIKEYHDIKIKAFKTVITDENPYEYAAWKLNKRNEWMVNNSNLVVACYDGSGKGGTYNCIRYAEKHGKEIVFINMKEL